MTLEQHQRVVVAEQLDPERVARRCAFTHPDQRHVVGEQVLADRELAAGTHQRFPGAPVGVAWFEQEHFGCSPGCAVQAQTGGDHPGLVQHEQIPLTQQLGQVTNEPVLRRGGAPVDEQSSRIPRLDRRLGDPFSRQLVVEVRDPHAPSLGTVNQ